MITEESLCKCGHRKRIHLKGNSWSRSKYKTVCLVYHCACIRWSWNKNGEKK